MSSLMTNRSNRRGNTLSRSQAIKAAVPMSSPRAEIHQGQAQQVPHEGRIYGRNLSSVKKLIVATAGRVHIRSYGSPWWR